MAQLQLTAVYMRVPEGYVAFVEELPGANTQGATLEDARMVRYTIGPDRQPFRTEWGRSV